LFYAPAHFAFQKLIDSGTKLDKLKNPRVVNDLDPQYPRTKRVRFNEQTNELGELVGEPALDDELEKEVAWVKRKLGKPGVEDGCGVMRARD